MMIEAAEMPIDDLGLGDDGITYKGVPFEQASQSEQLKVSAAIGLALNPGGIMLIRDGSLLDTKSLETLAEEVDRLRSKISSMENYAEDDL